MGKHRIFTKAIDMEGDVQPEHRIENERGYGHNGWRDHGLLVDVFEKKEYTEHSKKSGEATPVLTKKSKMEQENLSLSEAGKRGQKLFQSGTQPNCGHTLEHAKTTGSIGPNSINYNQPEINPKALQHGVGEMQFWNN